jgi:hypothetical protein
MSNQIFNPEWVWSISISGLGLVFPREHNQRNVICQLCRDEDIAPGAAVKFAAARFSDKSNGYICAECVAKMLKANDWNFQPVREQLFPSQFFTNAPISGHDLARAFLENGERGLFSVVENSLAVSSIVSL